MSGPTRNPLGPPGIPSSVLDSGGSRRAVRQHHAHPLPVERDRQLLQPGRRRQGKPDAAWNNPKASPLPARLPAANVSCVAPGPTRPRSLSPASTSSKKTPTTRSAWLSPVGWRRERSTGQIRGAAHIQSTRRGVRCERDPGRAPSLDVRYQRGGVLYLRDLAPRHAGDAAHCT
jgi:hypothetical protein